jgi:hypothetical protein
MVRAFADAFFTWRRVYRTPAVQSTEPMFAPVVVELT